jgi:hypothetical protein
MSTYTASIEEYPHIINRLCTLWGQPELIAYLDGLVTTERADVRTGFPMEVISELFWLSDIHRLVCPDGDKAGLWKHTSIYDEDHF